MDQLSLPSLLALVLLFFFTAVIGVVTGSNSLIAVPAMFQFGIDEKVAVATNMFGLLFMAVGGSIPFVRAGKVDYGRLWPLVVLTVISSALGAALVGLITNQGIKLIVTVAMIVVTLFTVLNRGPKEPGSRPGSVWLAYVLTFLLGVYGGLYSGGYVTILTATLVAFYGMSYMGSIAATKVINVFSSGIATLVFMWQGLVDYRLGVVLGLSMFVGAYAGAHYATKMNETLLRRIFVATVLLLALKTAWDLLA